MDNSCSVSIVAERKLAHSNRLHFFPLSVEPGCWHARLPRVIDSVRPARAASHFICFICSPVCVCVCVCVCAYVHACARARVCSVF